MNNLRQLSLATEAYLAESDGSYPPRSIDHSWILLLRPFYCTASVLRCPTEPGSDGRSYLINGFNDWFERELEPEDYEDFKNYLWPAGLPQAAIAQPCDTIIFGEKLVGSGQVHMDFFQGVGNDLDEVDHNRHQGRSNFAMADGSVRPLVFFQSVQPVNLWAVTDEWRIGR